MGGEDARHEEKNAEDLEELEMEEAFDRGDLVIFDDASSTSLDSLPITASDDEDIQPPDSPIRLPAPLPGGRETFPDRPRYYIYDADVIEFIMKIDPSIYYVTSAGRVVQNFGEFIEEVRQLPENEHVSFSFHIRMRGGKGGFGSLLRSFRVNKKYKSIDDAGLKRAKVGLYRRGEQAEETLGTGRQERSRAEGQKGKHDFNDPDYISKRDEILEKTEDACEAGFAYMKEMRDKKRQANGEKVALENDSEDSDEDVEDLFNSRGGRKRKIEDPTVDDNAEKRMKDDEDDSDTDSEENEISAEEIAALKEYFDNKAKEDATTSNGVDSEVHPTPSEVDRPIEAEGHPRMSTDSAANVDDLPKIDEKTPCEYPPVNLDDFSSAGDLELLGLEHLKSALTERELKCGGSLSERAARLFSVKGLNPKNYPNAILTPAAKARLAQEEAEEQSKKKKKKSKKN
ncbi:unnamed protein product [Caenorhabditis auriculariae]|uniref:SDE2/SF3A3 SAP domain-containing protein n=1 Tax=Caenorhabditis auriculariae TaxID=2777116 RepID=A0A8S1HUJ9_9PELO|nr:unnamed protein product [Caenorhabditis auriculariae]